MALTSLITRTIRSFKKTSIRQKIAAEFITLSQAHDLKMVMYVRDAMLYSRARPIEYMEALLMWSQTFPESQRPTFKRSTTSNIKHKFQSMCGSLSLKVK